MNKLNTLLIGLAVSALISGTALAATTSPTETHEPKPSTTSGPSPAPESTVTPSPAPASSTAPAVSTPAPVSSKTAVTAKEEGCKIGYIDMVKIANESASGKSATASMKARSAKLKAKIETKQKQLEKEKAAIEAKLVTLSPKERSAKAKEFQKKVEEYQKLLRSSDEEMAKMQEKLTSDLYKKIKKTAATYGRSHGYATIVEEKAMLYVSDSLEPKDVTDEITELLDEKTPAK